MILGIPFAIWLGFITLICLITTLVLGVAVFYFNKPVFKYHRLFAFLTILVALVHAVIALLLWFFGILI